MSQVPGRPAEDLWDGFSLDQKSYIVKQLAVHLSEIFNLHVSAIGSLYLRSAQIAVPPKPEQSSLSILARNTIKCFAATAAPDVDFKIGPLVCTALVSCADDDFPRSPVADPYGDFRGPFTSAGSWLASLPLRELAYTREYPHEALEESVLSVSLSHLSLESVSPSSSGLLSPVTREDLERPNSAAETELITAQQALSELAEIANMYDGPRPSKVDAKGMPSSPERKGALSHLSNKFALMHHDFRLANIHVDPVTAEITSILDWEATHSVPLWSCARLPEWICEQPPDGSPSPDSVGSPASGATAGPRERFGRSVIADGRENERAHLRRVFLSAVSPEWREAYVHGANWRMFQEVCSLSWISWTEDTMLERLKMYREQAEKHPGEPLDEEKLRELDSSPDIF